MIAELILSAIGLLVAVAGGAAIAARRSGISVKAWVLFLFVPFFAPKLDTEAAIHQAIARDRAVGPAPPASSLLKRLDLSQEGQGSEPGFRLSVKGGSSSPLRLLYLHGGGYILNVQAMQWAIPAGLLDRLGGQAVAPHYPLAPEHGWQESLASVERVYLDLAQASGAGNIVILGDSAGGGLALLLAQRLRDAGQPLPAALVLFSPWLDIGANGQDQPELAARDPALSIGFLRQAGQLWAKGLASRDPRVSPLYGDLQGLPPTIVFSGTRDILDSDALRLAHLNPAVDLRHYRNMIHVWPCAPIPEAKRALDAAAGFIAARMGGNGG